MAALSISGFFLFVLGNTLQMKLLPFWAKMRQSMVLGCPTKLFCPSLERDAAFIKGKVTG